MGKPTRFVPLKGSLLRPVEGFTPAREPVGDNMIKVALWLRRDKDAPPLPNIGAQTFEERVPFTREAFSSRYGASRDDIRQVREYIKEFGLDIDPDEDEQQHAATPRLIMISGTIGNFERAFGVRVRHYEKRGDTPYLGRDGEIQVPQYLRDIIEGVFGLDNRKIGFPVSPVRSKATIPLPTPPDIARRYGFPNVSAKGQCIALLQFGGMYDQYDIDRYFDDLGLPSPTIHVVDLRKTTPNPGDNIDYDREVTLDIDIAGSVASEAVLVVYFAPHTEQGWIEAVFRSVHDTTYKPNVISISWGGPELEKSNSLTWTRTGIKALRDIFSDAGQLGVTVLAATGNYGSDCNVGKRRAYVSYPASDPGVIACGGTSIDFTARPARESAWARSGGGISELNGVPEWQEQIDLPSSVNDGKDGRGLPDISGYADPGFTFIQGGKPFPASGTSLTAPLYAALVARLNALLGRPLGFLTPDLYRWAGILLADMKDTTSNSFNYAPGYHGGPGWDALTGLGVLDIDKLVSHLGSSTRT